MGGSHGWRAARWYGPAAWVSGRGTLRRHDERVDPPATTTELQGRVDAHLLWPHTLGIAPGVLTKESFGLRPVIDEVPWPGTFDVVMCGRLLFNLRDRCAPWKRCDG